MWRFIHTCLKPPHEWGGQSVCYAQKTVFMPEWLRVDARPKLRQRALVLEWLGDLEQLCGDYSLFLTDSL